MRTHRGLVLGLLLLGAVIAASAVLGPFVAGVNRCHTSDTTLNQITGGDAAALLLVAPGCVLVGVLAWRGHPAAPVPALAALFATYTFTQLIVDQEYLRLPGNNERHFPLLYAGFVLGGAVAVTAWRRIDPARLPAPTRRLERLFGDRAAGRGAVPRRPSPAHPGRRAARHPDPHRVPVQPDRVLASQTHGPGHNRWNGN